MLPVRVAGIAGDQGGVDLPDLLSSSERARRITDCQQRIDGFNKPAGFAAHKVWRHLSGFDELILQAARPTENVFYKSGGDSHRVLEPLRQVEHQAVGGVGGGGERVFGALALLVGNLSLLDGNTALPVGEPGESERDDKTGRQATGENIAAARGAAAALG